MGARLLACSAILGGLRGVVGADGLPQCGCNNKDAFAGRQDIANPGGNALYIFACPTAAIPPNGTCTADQLVPCQNVINPGNDAPVGPRFPPHWTCEFNPAPSSATAYYSISFATTDPYSWHVVASAPPAIYRPVAYGPTFVVPYAGGNGSSYCDSSADCYGAPCNVVPAPPRCGPLPSPSVAPSPPPVPTPTPGPPAVTCNLTGQWLQYCPTCVGSETGMASTKAGGPPSPGFGYRPEAYISIVSRADGTFSFSCSNDPQVRREAPVLMSVFDCGNTINHHIVQVGYCPLWTSLLNGTGTLSSVGPSVTASVLANGTAPMTLQGVLLETFSCATLNWTSAAPASGRDPRGPQPVSFPVQWQKQPPAAPPVLDISVTAATFLGTGPAAAGGQFVVSGIGILTAPTSGPALIAVAGNGCPAYDGIPPPVLLLGAAAGSNGTIVILAADVHAPRGSGATARAIVKVGARIDSLRANAAGSVVVTGAFGVAVISGLASGTPAVTWNDSLPLLEPGTCGTCCWNNGSAAGGASCFADIGDDGLVVASFAVQDANEGWLWGAYAPDGIRVLSAALNVARVTSVFVDASRDRFGVGYEYVSNTGQESMIMPKVDTYSYELGSGGNVSSLEPDFSLFDWDAHVYRQEGQPCYGDVADGRILDVRVGRSPLAPLLVSGRSDGGNSPFYCGMRNSSKTTPFTHIDDYTDSANMQSQAVVNMVVANGATGEGVAGQLQLTRLGVGGGGNTLLNVAAQMDAAGNVYELQDAAYCLPNMGNLTVNGQATTPPADSTALLVLDPTLSVRLHWAVFAAADAGPGDSGGGVDLDLRGDVVAFGLNSGQVMVTSGSLPGTGPDPGAALVGYVVVLPTASAAAAATAAATAAAAH